MLLKLICYVSLYYKYCKVALHSILHIFGSQVSFYISYIGFCILSKRKTSTYVCGIQFTPITAMYAFLFEVMLCFSVACISEEQI